MAAPGQGPRVIVTADDCGYSTPRDDGILEAFEAGLISRGSVMVNGMTARQMVARAVLVGMPVGLHLNLTEGLPLSPPSAIPSLVTMDPEYGKAMRTLAAALVALAASAQALTVSECTSAGSAATVTYDTTKACFKGTFASSGDLDITINVPSSMDGKDIELIMWNAAQSATFTATASYRSTLGTSSAVAVHNGRESSASATAIPFFYRQAISDVRMGEHHFVVSVGAGDWAFVVDQGYTQQATTIGSAAGAMYRVLPTTAAPSANVTVGGGFIAERVIVKEAKVDVTPASDSAAAAVASTMFATAASTSETTASGTTTAVFQRVARPAAQTVEVQVTLNNVATQYYNWAAAGPFMTGTVAMPAAGVTAYPKIKAGAEASLSITADARAFADVDVVEIELSNLWWNVTVNAPTTATVGGSPYNTGAPTVYFESNPASDAFTGGASLSTKTPSALVGADLTFENRGLYITNPLSLTLPDTLLASPVTVSVAPRYFLRVDKNANQPTTGALDVKLTYTTTNVSGSCMTYADCFASAKSHPGIRSPLSANKDATRLRQCMLVPSAEYAYRPTAQCLECLTDSHCGEGEYCHSDPGVCEDGRGFQFVCDRDSNARFGLCVAKDPTGEILGSGCRADTAAVFTSGTFIVSTAPAPLVANVATNEDGTSESNGYGFCGGAVYYNASHGELSTSGISSSGLARRVLWQGKCVDGICRECDEGSTANNGNMLCVNGRMIPAVTVDGTVRTASHSVLAATMLAATLMIVLAIIIGLVDCVCRHRWRSADVKQRKLMHKHRHAHKDGDHALIGATAGEQPAASA
ncbi:hypothetical protein FNF29_02984 [Cafeteria roenbergensis]|uniref:Carbohydrate deacetylase n=1 Tax=Cafeteria roenbergensis TaxID=33653 RepID=A0A5A8CKJ9_CAFRO|nr:hypothetical protein FNF29_02984 [Cafeteria roenbergensis]|eukprot:KAA0153596.1 hypothetical protein FNF29_02984 [Cafeteria roenbergensis]